MQQPLQIYKLLINKKLHEIDLNLVDRDSRKSVNLDGLWGPGELRWRAGFENERF